jgi:spore coat protein CotF
MTQDEIEREEEAILFAMRRIRISNIIESYGGIKNHTRIGKMLGFSKQRSKQLLVSALSKLEPKLRRVYSNEI